MFMAIQLEDRKPLSEIVARMKALPEPERVEMGRRGRDFALRNFGRERCLDTLEATLAKAAALRSR